MSNDTAVIDPTVMLQESDAMLALLRQRNLLLAQALATVKAERDAALTEKEQCAAFADRLAHELEELKAKLAAPDAGPAESEA